MSRECSVSGCARRDVKCRGLCGMHYARLRTKGETGPAHSLNPRVVEADGRKSCLACGATKPLEAFDKDYRYAHRRVARCRACTQVRERDRMLRTRYGVDRAWFDATLAAQGGACAICKRPADRMVVDHCHRTGAVRGVLCNDCNVGIGLLKDDADTVRRAAEYLTTHALGGLPHGD